MIDDYEKLHLMGIAHSIEAWKEGEQVGGIYGLAFGKMFFGESMFHQVPKRPRYVSLILQISRKNMG